MKTWFSNLKLKIKAGITRLYKNSWFNMFSVTLTALACFVLPTLGAAMWFLYFVLWGFYAEKSKIQPPK
jgi:hypothetical protein